MTIDIHVFAEASHEYCYSCERVHPRGWHDGQVYCHMCSRWIGGPRQAPHPDDCNHAPAGESRMVFGP